MLSPWDICLRLETFLVCQNREDSRGIRLNVPGCSGQSPVTKNSPAHMSAAAVGETLGARFPPAASGRMWTGTPVCPCAWQFWLSQLVFRGVSQPVSHSSPRAGPREPRNSDLEVIEMATKGQPKSGPQGTEGAEPSGGLCPCLRDCQPLPLQESFLEKKTLKSGDRAEGRNLPAAESIPVAPA